MEYPDDELVVIGRERVVLSRLSCHVIQYQGIPGELLDGLDGGSHEVNICRVVVYEGDVGEGYHIFYVYIFTCYKYKQTMKSPKKKKKRTKQDGGMSLWSRLRFAIDFDDDDISPPPTVVVSTGTVTPATAVPLFDTNLKQAISNTIAYYGSSSSSNFKDWYDRKTSLNGLKQMKSKISSSTTTTPSQELAKDIVNQLVAIDTSLVSYRINIETLVMSLFDIKDIANALFTTSKQPIDAMKPVLITQLYDNLKNAINDAKLKDTAGNVITVADGRGPRVTRKSHRKDGRKGARSRSPSRR